MSWRETFKVHPAADAFPMMSDEELAELGADIKANGLKQPVTLWWPQEIDYDPYAPDWDEDLGPGLLLDGRNRLAAMERAGVPFQEWQGHCEYGSDPVAFIISANIKRRHLTKQQQADLIVAAIKAGEKLDQNEPVSRGGRGKVNPVKAKAVATAGALGISEAAVKRSLAKAKGKTPKPKPKPEPKAKITVTMPAGIDAARKHYVLEFVDLSPAKRRAEWDKLLKAVEKAADEASS
jgi:hypothetical protein